MCKNKNLIRFRNDIIPVQDYLLTSDSFFGAVKQCLMTTC